MHLQTIILIAPLPDTKPAMKKVPQLKQSSVLQVLMAIPFSLLGVDEQGSGTETLQHGTRLTYKDSKV